MKFGLVLIGNEINKRSELSFLGMSYAQSTHVPKVNLRHQNYPTVLKPSDDLSVNFGKGTILLLSSSKLSNLPYL